MKTMHRLKRVGLLLLCLLSTSVFAQYPYQYQYQYPYQYPYEHPYPQYYPEYEYTSPYPTSNEVYPATPSIYLQNDSDYTITGAYTATIVDEHQQTNEIKDTFPVPTGRTATPPLPYYLNKEHLTFTLFMHPCTSTVSFDVENRGGSFYILQSSSQGGACIRNGQARKLSGTVLEDGFTILLLEEPA